MQTYKFWFHLKLFPKRFDRNLDGEWEARTGAWASREEVSGLVMVVLMVIITRGVVRVVGAVVVLVVVLLLWLCSHNTHRTVSWRRAQRGDKHETGDARVVASRSRSCCHRRCSLRCCRCHPSSAVCGRCNKLSSTAKHDFAHKMRNGIRIKMGLEAARTLRAFLVEMLVVDYVFVPFHALLLASRR